MKKWLLLLFVFLAIGIGCLYFVIPNRINIQQNLQIGVNTKGFARTISNEKKWSLWWPEKSAATVSDAGWQSLNYNGNTYRILEKKLTSLVISVKSESDSIQTELFFIPINEDSVALRWAGESVSPLNPVTRLQTFFRTKSISKDLNFILQSLQKFYAVEDNLYGLSIVKDRVLDSTLVSTSLVTNAYPSVENIYGLIDELQAFALKNNANQTGPPMLNIYTTDSISYRIQVALPVDKKLKDEGDIFYRWMLGGGNILVAEVKGGPHTINNAFAEMENYVRDYRRTAPAIPFQSLVTDRRKEPDTTKWITKVYWPVM